MSKGISNIEIEKSFKVMDNDNLNETFLGVYFSLCLSKWFLEKNILSWFQTRTEETKAGHIGDV